MANDCRRPHWDRDSNRIRAGIQEQARDVIEQCRAAAQAPQRADAPSRAEPMNRYIHPIPRADQAGAQTACRPSQAYLERILETLTCQNQLLLDLLAAINSLSAALLTAQANSLGG